MERVLNDEKATVVQARYVVYPVLVCLLVPGLASGQAVFQPAVPTISVMPSPAGASLLSYMAGRASVDFGRAAYFGGRAVAGTSARTGHNSFVLSTRFKLKVDCHGSTLV